MKIAKSKLKQIIKEELSKIVEGVDPLTARRLARASEKGRTGLPGSRKPKPGPEPEISDEEKKDKQLLMDADYILRTLKGGGYAVPPNREEFLDPATDSGKLMLALIWVTNEQREGNWDQIKKDANKVIKKVSNEFKESLKNDEEFRKRFSQKFDIENYKKSFVDRQLQSTY
jgi:hypothetical protein